MKTIWKFTFFTMDEYGIRMPQGAEILHVAMQGVTPQTPTLWALVDPNAEEVTRRLAIRGTGHDASDLTAADHVATVQQGARVWHVFDRGEE